MDDSQVKTIIAEVVDKVQADNKRHTETLMEFHRDEMKVMREYMDGRFDRLEFRVGVLETEMKQVTSALTVLLEEFKSYREKVAALEIENSELRSRVEVLEKQLVSA